MLLASFLFAFMGAFAKYLSQYMSSLEVVFFRNVFGVVLVTFSIYKTPMIQKGGRPMLLLFRGIMGFIALLAFFYNIAHIPLGDAITYSKTSAIFTAIFAYIFLKEKLSLSRWIAVFIGFMGIVFIMKPTGLFLEKSDILGVLSGVGAALAYTAVRELKSYYDTRAIVLSFMGVGTIGSLLFMMLAPYIQTQTFDFVFAPFVWPPLHTVPAIITMGVLATFSQIYMTKAYGETKAGIVGVVSYSNIVFSTILGLFLGDMFPDIITLLGIMLIVLGGLIVAKK